MKNNPIEIIHGDALKVLPTLKGRKRFVIITDPVWPNSHKDLKGNRNPFALFEKAAKHFPRLGRTLVVHLGCTSDPRFLLAVPKALPFFRVCWLRFSFPSYRGRVLIGSDVAYAFGTPPTMRGSEGRIIKGEIDSEGYSQEALANKWRDGSRRHPTPRKLDHVCALVELFSNPGDTVLDPFMGSGTTAVACKMLNRNFVGIEIEKKYCDLSQERLDATTPPMF